MRASSAFVVAYWCCCCCWRFCGCQVAPGRQCDVEECESLVVKCHYTDRCLPGTLETDAFKAKQCLDCLEEKAHLCCGCVGLCLASDTRFRPAHVGNLIHHDQEFFANFSQTPLMLRHWHVARLSANQVEAHNSQVPPSDDKLLVSNQVELSNACLLAFAMTRISMESCKLSCASMGAAAFRWFHTGCCQCVGKHCPSYGLHEPRCKMP